VPEYQRAVDAIKAMITAGKISVGLKVPEIAELTSTTYSTARRVAKQLETEGVLQAHPGKGYAIVAMPQEADARRADAKELTRLVGKLREEVRALSVRLDPAGEFGERLERVESNLEDLYDKLGYEYGDGTGEPPAARRGRTG